MVVIIRRCDTVGCISIILFLMKNKLISKQFRLLVIAIVFTQSKLNHFVNFDHMHFVNIAF